MKSGSTLRSFTEREYGFLPVASGKAKTDVPSGSPGHLCPQSPSLCTTRVKMGRCRATGPHSARPSCVSTPPPSAPTTANSHCSSAREAKPTQRLGQGMQVDSAGRFRPRGTVRTGMSYLCLPKGNPPLCCDRSSTVLRNEAECCVTSPSL